MSHDEGDGIPTTTIDTVVGCWRVLSDVCSGLSEAHWKMASDLPGWTVQDNLSHIVGTERALEGLDPAPPHSAGLDHVHNPIGDFNENEVELRRARAGADVLTEWNELRARREHTLATGDAAYFARPMSTPTGPGTMADFLALRVLDCWLHEQDIRRAIGRPGNLGGIAAEHTIDRLIRTIPIVVGKRAACPEGRGVVIRITGPVERTVACEVHDGRARPVDQLAGEAMVTVSLTTEAFVVLATGRRGSAAVAGGVSIEASTPEGHELGQLVVERLNMMI